ncbi:MAG: TlpA family protein disulfide reductase [Bacteroidetes bacterium]|nr:MAG: TlpA family protein disulfide reductase [Bacteroidota bacterium]
MLKKTIFFCLILFNYQIVCAQNAKIIKFDELQNLLDTKSDSIYVINFWATWCAPCVKELPAFENLIVKYSSKKLRIVLVSLDFATQFEKKVLPFLHKKQIKSEVWLLNELDYDTWIGKVDQNWQGNIPFTLIFNNKQKTRLSIDKAVDEKELEKIILPLL